MFSEVYICKVDNTYTWSMIARSNDTSTAQSTRNRYHMDALSAGASSMIIPPAGYSDDFYSWYIRWSIIGGVPNTSLSPMKA